MYDTGSRLFLYSTYIIPLLIVGYYIVKFKLETIYFINFIFLILLSIVIALYGNNINDVSLLARMNKFQGFFSDFSFINIIFPFINDYRILSNGSFHNELFEIFSFFGFFGFYYYFYMKSLFTDIKKKYYLFSVVLMFPLIVGGVIQLNLLHPYSGIIIGLVLSLIRKNN